MQDKTKQNDFSPALDFILPILYIPVKMPLILDLLLTGIGRISRITSKSSSQGTYLYPENPSHPC
jgi:hypothetical protein